MSNYREIKEEIKNYIYAGIPLIIIDSSERERVERMLRSISTEIGTEIYYYTDSRQVSVFNSSLPGIDAENDPLSYMSSFFRKKRKSIFAFGDVKRISEDSFYTREIINILYLVKEAASTLILITSDRVVQRIAGFGLIAKLDYPDLEERCEQISSFIEMYGNNSRYAVDWDEEDVVRAATLLSGFTEIQIDNILSNEIVSSGGLYKENIFRLTNQKDRLFASVSSIQSVKVERDMCISGLENLKSWLEEKKRIFFTPDKELAQFGLTSPKGILLAGVPGCGKSYSAKMVANMWELPLFRFDIGSVYDKWMGESERKMREALDFIDNVSPCILWVDEIEKAMATSDGGNDTSKRILGQFLFWLQESHSRVFMVATANDISALPSELFRKGRFSEVFFVDLPNESERALAITQYASRCLHLKFKEEQLEELVKLSEGFSFSEIEYAIKEIAQILLVYGAGSINMNVVREKFNLVVPIEKSNSEVVNKIRQWGRQNAVPAHKKG